MKICEISKDIVAYSCKKLNDNNIPLDQHTALQITLSIVENFQQNLDFQQKQNGDFKKVREEVINTLEPYCENSKV